eukprot:2562389-Lingulodinium_polyedra.AAC.1
MVVMAPGVSLWRHGHGGCHPLRPVPSAKGSHGKGCQRPHGVRGLRGARCSLALPVPPGRVPALFGVVHLAR